MYWTSSGAGQATAYEVAHALIIALFDRDHGKGSGTDRWSYDGADCTFVSQDERGEVYQSSMHRLIASSVLISNVGVVFVIFPAAMIMVDLLYLLLTIIVPALLSTA